MINVNTITVSINNQKILDALSVALNPGSINCFIGKSGAGKTTLLKAIAGLTQTAAGNIFINNQKITELTPRKRAEQIGYVFQNFNLFAHLTVLQNCIDPLLVRGLAYQEAEQIACATLKKLGIEHLAKRYSNQISGGQQQRVAIARALCLQPKIILLDEPTASLDPESTDTLVAILKSLAAQGLTIGLSSQDMAFVKKILDNVYYLENGRIVDFYTNNNEIKDGPIAKFLT